MDYVTWRNAHPWIPTHQILILDIEKISNPMGIRLGIDYVIWRKIHKWIPPHHIESSCGTQNKISDPMGVRLGIA